METLGTDDGKAGIGIAQNKYGIGLHFHHQLIALCDDIAHGFAQVCTHGFHVDVGVGEFEVAEEDPIEVVVVVLTGVGQQGVEVLAAFIDDGCQANDFGACADDNQ